MLISNRLLRSRRVAIAPRAALLQGCRLLEAVAQPRGSFGISPAARSSRSVLQHWRERARSVRTGRLRPLVRGMMPVRLHPTRVLQHPADSTSQRGLWFAAGTAGFLAGSAPARLDAASAMSGLVRERSRGRPSRGAVWVIARLQRRRSRAGGIEPPARKAGWKAGAPSAESPAPLFSSTAGGKKELESAKDEAGLREQ
jgi:hypothetical protein